MAGQALGPVRPLGERGPYLVDDPQIGAYFNRGENELTGDDAGKAHPQSRSSRQRCRGPAPQAVAEVTPRPRIAPQPRPQRRTGDIAYG